MSDRENTDISIRGMPKELWERIQRAGRHEIAGVRLSATQMTILLLQEAIDRREREGRNSGKIEDGQEPLEDAVSLPGTPAHLQGVLVG